MTIDHVLAWHITCPICYTKLCQVLQNNWNPVAGMLEEDVAPVKQSKPPQKLNKPPQKQNKQQQQQKTQNK